jgi:transcription elongation factor Elf1
MKPLQNFREVLKSLKHRKPTQIFCPRCCSPKIKLHSSFDQWLTPAKYICQNCGYTGPIIMELEKEENKSA